LTLYVNLNKMIITDHIGSGSIQEEGPTEDTDDVGSYSGITCHPGGPLGPRGMSEATDVEGGGTGKSVPTVEVSSTWTRRFCFP
jgi:hypothetical protein